MNVVDYLGDELFITWIKWRKTDCEKIISWWNVTIIWHRSPLKPFGQIQINVWSFVIKYWPLFKHEEFWFNKWVNKHCEPNLFIGQIQIDRFVDADIPKHNESNEHVQ